MPTLKQLRQKTGWTTFELASKAGVSISTINRLEKGAIAVSTRITYKVLNTLSEQLGQRIELEDVEGLQVKDDD